MANKPNNTPALSTEQAITIALQAERDSQAAIVESQREAERILQQARQQAHDISQRVDQRIARVHQHCKQLSEQQINHLQLASNAKLSADSRSLQEDAVKQAVQQLTEALTRPAPQATDPDS